MARSFSETAPAKSRSVPPALAGADGSDMYLHVYARWVGFQMNTLRVCGSQASCLPA